MESYSYSGNSGFFDDLDIEGRNFVIDEWHAEEPFAKTNPENPGPIESPVRLLFIHFLFNLLDFSLSSPTLNEILRTSLPLKALQFVVSHFFLL